MAETPSFEIPPELRDMAEKNVEQARAAYGQFMDFLTQAMGAWANTPGARRAGRRLQGHAGQGDRLRQGECRALIRAGLRTARAKDIQEVVTLQSRYAQTQMQTFGIQAQQISWLMADALRAMQSKG